MTQLQIFSHNLNSYISKAQKTQKEIANSIGVLPATLNTWTQGKNIPRMDKIQLLADYFHIKKSDLLENKENLSKSKENLYLTETEIEIIKAYRECVPELQLAIMDMLHISFKKDSVRSESVG